MKNTMFNAEDIIERFRQRGVIILLEGDRLGIRAPKGVLNNDDKHLLALNKSGLVEHLRRSQSDSCGEFPLTEIQQAYWVGRRAMTLGNVGCHAYRELSSEDIDPARLQAAWRMLIKRHEMLRAVVSGEGRQRVLDQVPDYHIQVLDLRGQEDTRQQLAAVRASMSHHTFDPAVWPLFDIRVTRLDNEVRIHIGMDLLIADAASMLQLYREWGALYHDPLLALPVARGSFRDYVQNNLPAPDALARAEAYWRPRLAELPGAPELPLAMAPDQIKHPRFVRHSHTMDAKSWTALRERARAEGLTPSNLLVAAYADILAAWSKSQRFLITLTAFRAPPEYAQVVGDFTSTLVLEADATADRFIDRARALQTRLLADMEHDAWSGVRVIRELSRARKRPADPIPVVFTSALGHQSSPDEGLPISWLGQTVEAITQTPQVWIDHHAIEDGDKLVVSWDLVRELFPSGMDGEMFNAYRDLLQALASDEAAWQLPLGSHLPDTQLQRRKQVNATATATPVGFLHDNFFQRAQREPDRVAIVTPTQTISYGQLAGMARAVARAVDTGRNRLVGICMEKGYEQVAAALGVLAAGGAYLPIDPALPEARRRLLAENGELSLILTRAESRDLDWPEGIRRLAVDTLQADDTLLEAVTGATPDDLAYVIYTSGSTGEPKGVMMTHRAAMNTIADINRRFAIGEEDAVLALSSLSFDLSVYDIFGLLGAGGRLVLPDAQRLRDPAHWLGLISKHGVTVWNTVPALLSMLLEYERPLGDQLRTVMLSGDWVPLTLPERLRELAPQAKLYALGGATEAGIWSNWFQVDHLDPSWRSIPYGWPLANQRYRILNEVLEPCPDWVPGKLYIGGDSLAEGYWRDPRRTADKFISHPGDGERLYETGDLGRYLPDGAIEFLGREDFQVKISGHRVELGEIEATLRAHPRVNEAIAVVPTRTNGERRLAAYVLADTADAHTESELEQPSKRDSEDNDTLTDPVERLAFLLRRPAIRATSGDKARVPLPGPSPDPQLWNRRRTVRHFSARPLALHQLGELLGCLRGAANPRGGLPKYRYPSAGTSYAVQTWLHIKDGRVEGLPGGFYYYHPDRHDLESIAPGAELTRELHVQGNDKVFAQGAFSIFLVAAMEAIRPLYGELARDFCLLEAGYMGQLLMQEVAASELGLCAIGALNAQPPAARLPTQLQEPLQLGPQRELLHSFIGGIAAEDGQQSGKPNHDQAQQASPSEPDKRQAGGTNQANPLNQTPSSMTVPTPIAISARQSGALNEELRAWLSDRLPHYMVPDDLLILDQFPLSANGKIDRARLPEIQSTNEAEQTPPRNALEKTIADIFSEVLALPEVGRDHLVFDLGGTSVHMIRIHRKLEEALKREIDIVDLFRAPSVSRLAAQLEARSPTSAANAGSARGAARSIPRRRSGKDNKD